MRVLLYLSTIVVALQSTAAAQGTTEQFQYRWEKCVEYEYKLLGKINPSDQEIAVELAFEYCAPEEEELRANISKSGAAESFVDQLRAKIERSLPR